MRNFLKLRKNREFNYRPRYYKGESNPFRIEHKLDKFRTTDQYQRGLRTKFSNAFNDLKNEGDQQMRIRFLITFAILILIFLFIIDFDFSIFLVS